MRKITTLGLSPHSGWTAAVVLGGSVQAPLVLARTRIEMYDSKDPESKQPYHAVEEVAVREAARRLEGWMTVAARMATSGLKTLVSDLSRQGLRLESIGILESSGRKGGSLEATLASHALIHTADGDHYRNALATAAERISLSVSRVRARDLENVASSELGRPVAALREAAKNLGRQVGPPWGADQKTAALFAWLLLSRVVRS